MLYQTFRAAHACRCISFVAFLALLFHVFVFAQEKAVLIPTTKAITVLDVTREQDGLLGPVRHIRSETVQLTEKDGRMVEGARVLLESTTYDPKGNRIENVYYPVVGSNSFTGRQEYKYDQRGNVVEMSLLDGDGSVLSREVYQYDFDSVGNWTKMLTSVVVFADGKQSLEPTDATYRTITYYLNSSLAKIVPPAPDTTTTPAAPSEQIVAPENRAALSTTTPDAARSSAPLTPEKKAAAQQSSIPASELPTPDSSSAITSKNESPLPAPAARAETASDRSAVAVKDHAPAPVSPAAGSATLTTAVGKTSQPSIPKAISIPPPIYPAAAKSARASGKVTVEIVIDERGRVISAQAVSGSRLLRGEAERAAKLARFLPPVVSGQSVKSTGEIIYNFVLQN